MSAFTYPRNMASDFVTILKTAVKLLLGRGVKKSYAQNGEDAIISGLVGKQRDRVYVDVGAFHPVQYSNTYSLYKRGWKGIAIDPNPRAKILFKIFRPRDEFVLAGISNKKETRKYFTFSDPAYNTMDEDQRSEWIKKGVKELGSIEVKCLPLLDILSGLNVKKIDVLSIDVEGLDLEVLKSHDWNIPTGIVIVESHGFDLADPSKDPIFSFLSEKGYKLESFAGFSLIFRNCAYNIL